METNKEHANEIKGHTFTKNLTVPEASAAVSIYEMGRCYSSGINVPRDNAKAAECFEKAAEAGLVDAIFSLALCYTRGQCVPPNQQKAIELCSEAAVYGCDRAQFFLGSCYQTGWMVPQDFKKAAEWYTKAAEQGDADAQYSIGFFYENGLAFEKDYEKALVYYITASEQGNELAFEKLVWCCKLGRGIPHECKPAVDEKFKHLFEGSIKVVDFLIFLKNILKDYQEMDYSPVYNNVSCHRPIDPMIIEKILYSKHP